jgi:hypothetical protein
MPDMMTFRRIVLYIDDLDRCEADKVVEVLQAVNMLLSFRLFVVLVAVDARWLSRSLETRYPEFFGVPGKNRENTEEKTDEPRGDRATAADYLEKIFQIPYWVPPMGEETSKGLVGDLVAADRIGEQQQPPPPPPPPVSPIKPDGPLEGGEDDQPQTMQAPSRALGLTKDEISALTAFSPFLGGSPRRARRFVNVYRVAKASLTPGEVRKLEDGEHRALATQLAIATGAPNAFALWMEACAAADDSSIKERVSKLAIDNDERRNIDGALGAFRKMDGEGSDVVERLAAQAARASRFSFVLPRRAAKPA